MAVSQKYPLLPCWLQIRYRMCILSSTPASSLQDCAPSVVPPTEFYDSSRLNRCLCRSQWPRFWNTKMSYFGRTRFQDSPVSIYTDFSTTSAPWRDIRRYFSHGVLHWSIPTMRFFSSWRSRRMQATSSHTTRRISLEQSHSVCGSFAPVNYSRRYRPCPH